MVDAEENDDEPLVADPEDFAQRERLRQIYDARQEFQEARQEADQLRSEQGWPLWKKENYVLYAFQRYFFEVEGLMERHPKGDYYLDEVKLGAVLPPEASDEYGEGLEEIDNLPDEARVFIGLRSLARDYRPTPTSGYRSPSDGDSRASDTEVQVTVPMKAITRAFRKVNEFIAEVGLDADMQGDTEEGGFDYSDLLDEGPPDGEGEKPGVATDGGGDE